MSLTAMPSPHTSVRILKRIAVVVGGTIFISAGLGYWKQERAVAQRTRQADAENAAREHARAAALESLKRASSPDGLRVLLDGFDKDTAGYAYKGGGLRDAFRHWYARDLRSALGMMEALPEDARYQAFRWGEDFYQQDPALFLSSARHFLAGSWENSVSCRIFLGLGKSDPAKGLALLPDVKNDLVRRTVIETFYSMWADREPREAMESASTLENPGERAIAFAAIVTA